MVTSASTVSGAAVSARGVLSVGTGTQHHRLADARVSAAEDWDLPTPGAADLEAALTVADVQAPVALDLTDEELDGLLDALRAG